MISRRFPRNLRVESAGNQLATARAVVAGGNAAPRNGCLDKKEKSELTDLNAICGA
jgi:hypothetical protein